MILRSTQRFTYRDGTPRKFYGCSQYPSCTAAHGAHPDGKPLGTAADKETKQARIVAHAAFDDLWRSGKMSRRAAYRELQRVMGMKEAEAHIGKFTKGQCEELVRRLEQEANGTE